MRFVPVLELAKLNFTYTKLSTEIANTRPGFRPDKGLSKYILRQEKTGLEGGS